MQQMPAFVGMHAGMVWKGEQTATLGLQEVQGHRERRGLEEGPDGCVLACADQTQCCQQEFL